MSYDRTRQCETERGQRPPHPQQHWEDLRQQIADGLRSVHRRSNANTAKTLEAASFLYALIELLGERGLIAIEQLDERKRTVMERQKRRYENEGMGVILQDPQPDKYTFERTAQIDCEARVHLCKASCCRIPFALSKQDLEERVVRWNLAIPYMIDHGEDGYCTHLDGCTRSCTIYRHRPLPCRGYDCRKDKRIWLDFEGRIPNPAVDRSDWLQVVSQESADRGAGDGNDDGDAE